MAMRQQIDHEGVAACARAATVVTPQRLGVHVRRWGGVQARAEEEEFRRAQERLTLKHRNTSRWARRALKRGLSLATDNEREALQEQLRLGRELRAKTATARDGSDSDARFAPLACMHARSRPRGPSPCGPAL